ncbi:hypothetical protein RR46_11356 [Papilio xuthus]|uniref:Uncharacterized protein n=1 Tax=Papilio xuthus TaxID=66420 RepID=A0A194PRR5_PAPXU|nr:hypothetical protein RR46_11356 [Papilio xuthus]
MGCGCSAEGQTIASYIFMFERFGSSIALTLIVCCMMLTTVGMLSLGIGLGYNYCFVDFKVKKLYGKRTQELNLQITRTGTQQMNGTQSPMDEALTSSLFFAKIIDLGRAIIEDGHNYIYSYKTKTSNKTEDIKILQ